MKKIKQWFLRFLYKLDVIRTTTIQEEIELKIKVGFTKDNLEPIRCIKCGHKEFIFQPIDYINNRICEANVICKKCETINGYWSYGRYFP